MVEAATGDPVPRGGFASEVEIHVQRTFDEQEELLERAEWFTIEAGQETPHGSTSVEIERWVRPGDSCDFAGEQAAVKRDQGGAVDG